MWTTLLPFVTAPMPFYAQVERFDEDAAATRTMGWQLTAMQMAAYDAARMQQAALSAATGSLPAAASIGTTLHLQQQPQLQLQQQPNQQQEPVASELRPVPPPQLQQNQPEPSSSHVRAQQLATAIAAGRARAEEEGRDKRRVQSNSKHAKVNREARRGASDKVVACWFEQVLHTLEDLSLHLHTEC